MKKFKFIGSVFTEVPVSDASGEPLMRGRVSMLSESGEGGGTEQTFYFKTFEEMARILKKFYEETL